MLMCSLNESFMNSTHHRYGVKRAVESPKTEQSCMTMSYGYFHFRNTLIE